MKGLCQYTVSYRFGSFQIEQNLHDSVATSKHHHTSLIIDGFIYEFGGEKLKRKLSPNEVSSWLLAAYLERPEKFFERVYGQATITIVEPKRVLCFRTLLSPPQVFYSKHALSNRLLSVYRAENQPRPCQLYFHDFMMGSRSLQYESSRCPIEGIYRLPPGNLVCLENGKSTVFKLLPKQQYPYHYFPNQSVEEAATRARSALEEAIETQLGDRSRPVVCELSGGLDSSFITTLVASRVPKITAYMYSYNKSPSHHFSEVCAKTVAKHLGISITVIPESEFPKVDLTQSLPYYDEPNSFFWQRAIFGNVAKQVVPEGSIVFTGFGSDQLFLRNPQILAWLLRRGKVQTFLESLSAFAKSEERSRVHFLWQAILLTLPRKRYKTLSSLFEKWRFNPFALAELDPMAILFEPIPWLKFPDSYSKSNESLLYSPIDPAAGLSTLEFSFLEACRNDPYLDRIGAWKAHPYCDSRVMEYLLKDVSWQHVHDWKNPYKHLLREAQKGWVPDEVRTRKKNEFCFDGFLGTFLADNGDYLYSVLNELSFPFEVSIHPEKAHHALEQLKFGVTSNSAQKILLLIAYVVWWRDFQAWALTKS